jgi:pimeloyl-ACP methyl ester carboxylesterase
VTRQVRRFSGVGGLGLEADVWDPAGSQQRPDIVLLHGGGQTRSSWKRAGQQLGSRGFRVVALDSRGHGHSDWSAEADYGLPTLAGDVLAVLDELARPAVLIGASMGGLTALVVAEQAAPEQLAAMVLVDIVPRYEKAGSGRVRDFMQGGMAGFDTLQDAADAIAAYLPHRTRPRKLDGLRKNLRQREDGRWYWHWDPAFMSRPGDDPADRLDRLERAAGSIVVPTLLVYGLKSDVVTRAGIDSLLELIPHAAVTELPSAAHTAAGDDNDAFAAAVIAFAEALGSGA